ncbi:DUF4411 family protein [Bradyrhizobium genosp. P]|uniref:DUF4411 family protein n=1 Tax=Bradyrhizobium genosp. P TaxID=83641 RepID=UPI003CE8548C
MAGLVYSVDSSALIHAWHRIYRPKNFGFVWDGFNNLVGEGRFKSSIEVYNELQKKDDELFAWCKERKDAMFVEIDDTVQAIVARIMAAHPKLVDTTKGRSGADPFVMALAASTNPQMWVVTEEYPGKERIPDVCDAQKIDYCRVADLIEKEGWTS